MGFSPEELKKAVDEAEAVAVGIGAEFQLNGNDKRLLNAYERLSALLEGKNYFILTTCTDGLIYQSGLGRERITTPADNDTDEVSEDFVNWDGYTDWLQKTLNRRLVLLELGADFLTPGIIRWPFERIAMLNNKAKLYRINGKFPQLPEGINDKGAALGENSLEFIIKYF